MPDASELASYVQPLYIKFKAECAGAGIGVVTIDIKRTVDEQQVKIAQGVSWTQNSKHLPQPPEMKSEAFDVCPSEYLILKNWNPTGPLWAKRGDIGESIGLKWGGRWTTHPDPGHFEWQGQPPMVTDESMGVDA